jgi:hypothetical protein
VLLPNATTGLNIVIGSAGLGARSSASGTDTRIEASSGSGGDGCVGGGGALYLLDIGYGSVKKMAAAACSTARVVYGHVTFPLE